MFNPPQSPAQSSGVAMATSVILVTSMAKAISIVMATSTCHAATLFWWQQFSSRQCPQKQHALRVIDLGNAVMWNTRYSGYSAALGVNWYVYVYVGMYVFTYT